MKFVAKMIRISLITKDGKIYEIYSSDTLENLKKIFSNWEIISVLNNDTEEEIEHYENFEEK
jgi:hypothetical protein